MSKIMIEIPLTKYLRELVKPYGGASGFYVTKTYGGQVWISNDAPGELLKDEGSNYVEFNDSDIFIKLPKEIHQHFNLKAGHHKKLVEILEEIKEKESKS